MGGGWQSYRSCIWGWGSGLERRYSGDQYSWFCYLFSCAGTYILCRDLELHFNSLLEGQPRLGPTHRWGGSLQVEPVTSGHCLSLALASALIGRDQLCYRCLMWSCRGMSISNFIITPEPLATGCHAPHGIWLISPASVVQVKRMHCVLSRKR